MGGGFLGSCDLIQDMLGHVVISSDPFESDVVLQEGRAFLHEMFRAQRHQSVDFGFGTLPVFT